MTPIRIVPFGLGVVVAVSQVAAEVPPRERLDDPYLPAPELRVTAPPAAAALGPFASVQVNVDALGNNIVGDAANEPSIAVDPTAPNRIVIGWRQFDNIASNFRQAGYSYSSDGGRTWAAESVIEPGLFRSDPVLSAAEDGSFLYLSLHVTALDEFICDMFVSSDGGATWPVKNFAFGGDKSWFTIDRTAGPGSGHLYEAWNTAGNSYFPNQFSRSTDGGLTWEDPVQYDPVNDSAFPVFGTLDVGPGGAVYVAGSANSGDTGTFWLVRSTNAQDQFQTPGFDLITPLNLGGNLQIGVGPNPAGLLGQVNVAVDRSGGPHDGNVYVLCSVSPNGPDPMEVHLIRSTDGGVNFTGPVRVNDDLIFGNNWQWFGTLGVAPNGRIDVVFNDTRDSGQDNISRLYYASSTDGGLSFGPNVAISPPFDSHVGWPNQSKIGDYYDLVSDDVGASLAWAATFNGEQDVYFLRIGDYDCNGNGVGDADDIAARTSADCNANGIPDECEIAAGTATDGNGNGVLDECECPWDCDGNADGIVSVTDLLALLAQYDPSSPNGCTGGTCDFNNDGCVDVVDLLKLLAHYDPLGQGCPSG